MNNLDRAVGVDGERVRSNLMGYLLVVVHTLDAYMDQRLVAVDVMLNIRGHNLRYTLDHHKHHTLVFLKLIFLVNCISQCIFGFLNFVYL